MAKKKRSKSRTFSFEEFKKEFYNKDIEERPQNKSRLYIFGTKLARESLAGSGAETTS